ncbi:hypothetical protein M3583_22600, partial [Bacillus subtilis]|nr:hypothetical protein [Bacillus subtilis]
DDVCAPDAVIDVDGEQHAFLQAHGIAAYIKRPDFIVFGSVADLRGLGALVDALRDTLHWSPRSTTPAAVSAPTAHVS